MAKDTASTEPPLSLFHQTEHGRIYLGDSLRLLKTEIRPRTVDLIMTSPPFGLVRKKDYGNVDADHYVEWFKSFAAEFRRVLKDKGSLVIDIGGAWIPGTPTKSLYQYELLISLCKDFDFHLAQEFFWWNPARLPTPAEWVTVRRVRVKDAVNCIWWLSPSPWPKASNKRVLQPYSESMKELLVKGYKPRLRPSGHDISDKFGVDNGGAIPPNLLAIAATESNSAYMQYCTENNIKPHPARFPEELPEFFIRMLTDRGNLVLDPFAGSCVTGEAAEKTGRQWICCELIESYLDGALGRFANGNAAYDAGVDEDEAYRVFKPGALRNGEEEDPLPDDGGAKRPPAAKRRATVPRQAPVVRPLPVQMSLIDVRRRGRPRVNKNA